MALSSFCNSFRAASVRRDAALLHALRHSSCATPPDFSRPSRRRKLCTTAPLRASRAASDGLTAEQQAELRNAFGNAGSSGPNLGPFPRARLDNTPLSGSEERTFRELGLGGKVARVGRKSGQWVFVGAGISVAALVAYSTISELFAKNSPTRLYEQAIERLENHSELRSILGDRLIFYGDHPSARKRRQHRVQHTLTPDRAGKQIMTLTFWVEAKGDDVPWHVRARTWLHELVWEPSADHFLSNPTGTSLPPPPTKPPASAVSLEAATPSWWSWFFGSLFHSIAASWRGRRPPADKKPKRPVKPALGEFTTGEATAILKQDSKGRFVFHSLAVDVPEKGRGNYRVWVIRPSQAYTSQRRR